MSEEENNIRQTLVNHLIVRRIFKEAGIKDISKSSIREYVSVKLPYQFIVAHYTKYYKILVLCSKIFSYSGQYIKSLSVCLSSVTRGQLDELEQRFRKFHNEHTINN
ncbi:MAG: hypothetical protein KBG40_02170 [Bacteroidales bacterium]|nr:hypothetical protein [Bacteroidales bacterium]